MFCKSCGQEVPEGMVVCNNCGNIIPEAYNATTPQTNANNGVQMNMNTQEAGYTPNQMGYAPNQTGYAPNQMSYAPNQMGYAPNMGMPVNPMNAPKKNSGKTVAVLMVVAVIAIITIIATVGVLVFGENKSTPIKEVVNIANKQETDPDKIIDKVGPKFLTDAYFELVKVLKKSEYSDYVEDIYEEAEGALEDVWDDVTEEMEDEYGKNIKYSFKVDDYEELDEDILDAVVDFYQVIGGYKSEVMDIVELVTDSSELEKDEVKKVNKIIEGVLDELDNLKISKAYVLELEVTVEGKDDDESTDVKVVVAKVNGEWIIEPISTIMYQNEEYIKDKYDKDVETVIAERIEKYLVDELKDEGSEALEELAEYWEALIDYTDMDVIKYFGEYITGNDDYMEDEIDDFQRDYYDYGG